MTKFQEKLKAAIEELVICERHAYEESHIAHAEQKLEQLIARCCDVKALELACNHLSGSCVKSDIQYCDKPETWIKEAEKQE